MQMDFLPGSQTLQVRSKGKGKGKGDGAKAGQAAAIELALVNIVSTAVCTPQTAGGLGRAAQEGWGEGGSCVGGPGVTIRAHVRVCVVG